MTLTRVKTMAIHDVYALLLCTALWCGCSVQDAENNPGAWDLSNDSVPKGMVNIPEGSFMMGTPVGVNPSATFFGETPVHKVILSRYSIDVHEVTVAQYTECVREGQCDEPVQDSSDFEECNYKTPGRLEHPINCVTWLEANNYCASKGLALPTEAHWEMAARGTQSWLYPWGDSPKPNCELAIVREITSDGADNGCGQNSTWPVGSRPQGASPHGVMDMIGNVAEWTADIHDKQFYTDSPLRDPANPETTYAEKYYGIRGGGWSTNLHSYNSRRGGILYSLSSFSLGFRCVK